MLDQHLGELLARLRARAGLRRADMIREFGISRSYSYWLESVHAVPGARLLEEMLDRYNATEAERLLAYRLRRVAAERARVAAEGGGRGEEDTSDDPTVDSDSEEPTVEIEIPVSDRAAS